jgi:hypothetical protein
VLWAALLALLTGGGGYSLAKLRSFVLAQPGYGDSAAAVVVTDPPDWMDPHLVARIAETMLPQDPAERRTFDPALSRRVYQAALESPWIRRVEQVRVERAAGDRGPRSAGRVLVRAEFRRPVASVQYDDPRTGETHMEYVDAEGVVLPANQIGRYPLVVVYGVQRRPPEPGRLWADPALQYGLEWIRHMQPHPWYREIGALNVSNWDLADRDAPAVTAVAQNDHGRTLVLLGRLPEDGFAVSEPAPQAKLEHLDDWYYREGSLVGREHLNVMFPELHASPY